MQLERCSHSSMSGKADYLTEVLGGRPNRPRGAERILTTMAKRRLVGSRWRHSAPYAHPTPPTRRNANGQSSKRGVEVYDPRGSPMSISGADPEGKEGKPPRSAASRVPQTALWLFVAVTRHTSEPYPLRLPCCLLLCCGCVVGCPRWLWETLRPQAISPQDQRTFGHGGATPGKNLLPFSSMRSSRASRCKRACTPRFRSATLRCFEDNSRPT